MSISLIVMVTTVSYSKVIKCNVINSIFLTKKTYDNVSNENEIFFARVVGEKVIPRSASSL